jgi:hypothetical protein
MYVGCVKLFAETREIFTHAVFSSSSPAKMLPGTASVRRSKRWKKEGARSGLKGG